jgi:hypothetical protein
LGKADDKEEETGICTSWDRLSRGPRKWERYAEITSGRSRGSRGAGGTTCKDSFNEAKAEIEERHTGLAHEFVRAMTEE